MSLVAVTGESEATRQKKKRPKLKRVEVGVAPTQSPHASEPLLATPFLQTPAQSPAPGTPILEEVAAAAMRKERKIRKEKKTAALPLPPNPNLEEEEEAVMATMKNRKEPKYVEIMLTPRPASVAKTPIFEQEKVTKKRMRRMDSPLPLHPGHASKPLLATPLLQHPAPEILTLKEAAAMMSKRKMPKEQKVDALPFAPNPALEEEQGEEAMMTMMKKEPKHVEQILLSLSTSVAVGNPIRDQEVKVIKKQKQRQEPSGKSQKLGNSPSPVHSGHASKPLLAAPLLQPPAPEILTLKEAAMMMMKKKMPKEQKVDMLPFAQNPTLEEEEARMTMMKKEPKRVEQILLPLSISVAVGNPIQEQEVKVIKKQKQRRGQEPSGKSQKPDNSPLPLHSGHASKPLLAAPPLQSPAPKILTLGEAAAMMRKRKMCEEQKVAVPSFSQNPTLEEEQGEEAMTVTTKERKCVEQILSCPSTSVAAETPIEEQEVTVTKKQKERRGQEPSGKSPLPLEPGQTRCVQSHRANAPPEQEGENDRCKGIKKSNGKKPRNRVLSKRELIQEARKQQRPLPEGFVPFSNFVASCTEQNPDQPYSAFFDQFRYDPVCGDCKPPFPRTPDRLARLPPRGYSSFESSQLTANETSRASKFNTTLASNTKLQDSGSGSQEKVNVKVNENPENRTWEKKQRKPSSKSRLPFDPSQTCCVQLQGTKAPPDQDQETDTPKINNIEESNSKKAHARAPIKRELFKEMTKGQALPEGFLVPRDFVPNCTEQSPNYSSPSGASFDQFCYRSARQDLHPQPPRTTDCLSNLPTRHYPSFESSGLTVSETSQAFKANSSVASKSKKKDSGSGSTSGSQKKLNVREKKNPEKKTTTTKQRKPPPVFTTAEKRSDKYRRVPLDQLVPPPRSPHNLLQENYASDPWKVIIICMFLNVTQGVQVKKILEGFFECYPDAQSAFNADPDKMAEYLQPLGLQHEKTRRIQKFSKQYVEKEWTHITELCGVGKYAADAYAIFCAGRAMEVVPEDHKLVDYWNYVCSELPMMQDDHSQFELFEAPSSQLKEVEEDRLSPPTEAWSPLHSYPWRRLRWKIGEARKELKQQQLAQSFPFSCCVFPFAPTHGAAKKMHVPQVRTNTRTDDTSYTEASQMD